MSGRGRAGGPGKGEGAPRLPSHPLRINGPAGGGGRAAAACGGARPLRPRLPRRAQRSLPAGPARAPPRPGSFRGAGGLRLFSSLLTLPAPGSRLGEGSRGSPSRPGSGRLVAASGTRGGGPPGALLPLPSLPPWEALEDFLPLRPPRCPPDMVGHLQLQGMDESLKEKSREGLLDSPDSGLPPSPSPPFYSLSPGEGRAGGGSSGADPPAQGHRREAKDGKVMPYLLLNPTMPEMRPRMYPVFFGESIEVSPEPVQEIRCNSEVKYDSEKHYRDDIFYGPIPTVTTYSETVIAAPNCTWRNYKSQLIFEPRQKPLRFQSTTIIFPKRAKNIYRTTLNYSLGCAKRWFSSSVQLELCEETSPCVIYSETL
ncbi:refilin-A [Anas platyrhynchos]|nr:LOW QUALITY PROTEIN: refilin-A [Anas platyrhynchos]